MNTTIALFLLFGAGFGLLSYGNRHLFSEGSTQPQAEPAGAALGGRLMWMLLCTFLWPLMALSGLNSLWLLRSRRRAAARAARV